MPSRVSPAQVSGVTIGNRCMALAEALTRAQCKSRSGVTPSKVRAPSNTEDENSAACERVPMIGILPSRQSPSWKVQVFDQFCPIAIRKPFPTPDCDFYGLPLLAAV